MAAPTGPPLLHLDEIGNVALVRLAGGTRDEEWIRRLGQQLDRLADELHQNNVILDLTGVDFLVSSLTGKLIAFQRRLTQRGIGLVLCHLTPMVEETITRTSLHQMFAIRRTLADALKSFAEEGENR